MKLLQPIARKFSSLRFRLTAWNTLVMAIVIVLMLLAVHQGLRVMLTRESRELLREEASELAAAVRSQYPNLDLIRGAFQRTIDTHRPFGWRGKLVDGNGTVVWSSDDLAESMSRGELQERFVQVDEVVDLSPTIVFHVHLSMPYAVIKRDVDRISRVVFGIGLVALLTAPIGGYLLARRATQPVRQIIRTTRGLNPTSLNERLVVRGTNDELDQISTEINKFLDQIAQFIQSQREFVANAAHELRSPLAAIQTGVEVALSQPRSTEEYAELLETITEECGQLASLVNQLLELAETEAPSRARPMKVLDLCALVRRVVEIYGPVAEDSGIRLNLTLPSVAHVRGDANRLRQVALNLLDNALKFTGENGTVSVAIRIVGDTVELSVADSGCGIPDTEQARIFDRFYQANRARTREERRGNGLGLSICKSIVVMHGGTISVDSAPGQGATFTVQLPVAS